MGVSISAIPISDIIQNLRNCGAGNFILFLDACRNSLPDHNTRGMNSISRDISSIGKQTVELVRQAGIVTIFSCSPGELAYELDTYQHGVFTYALLQGMQGEYPPYKSTVSELSSYLRRVVPELTQNYRQQTPYVIAEPIEKASQLLLPYTAQPDFFVRVAKSKKTARADQQPLIDKQSLIAQSFKNDVANGKDLLGIEDEVNALAEVLGMRALRPPLAVGILGGWGSGKSFVMHLMRQRLKSIYQQSVSKQRAWAVEANNQSEEISPFVGHIYQIYFNSWTYAKADLWSSLMQTIFYELNYQLTLEKHLRNTFAIQSAVTSLIEELAWKWKLKKLPLIWLILKEYDCVNGITLFQLEDFKALSSEAVTDFIRKLIKSQNGASALLQILNPKFWQHCVERHNSKISRNPNEISQLKLSSKQALSQDSDFLYPSEWEKVPWIDLKEEIDTSICSGATEQWKDLTCQTLSLIWEQAQASATEKLRKGGSIWSIIDSKLTANERDSAIKAEPSLGALGFLCWQEQISNSRTQGVIWKELSNLRKHDQQELDSIEKTLLSAEKKLESNKRIAELAAKKRLENRQTTIIWQPILNQSYKLLGIDPDRVESVRDLLKSKIKLSWRGYVAFACLAALLVVGVSTSWKERIEALQAIISAYRNIWYISFPTTAILLPKIWNVFKQYVNDVKQSQAKLDTEYQEWLQEEQQKCDLSTLAQEVDGLRLQAEQKRRQVGLMANQTSLLDFVNNRLQEDSYGSRLGLIHQISRDLDGLSQRLVQTSHDKASDNFQHIRKLFPRGPARVILYIDDLDRCPPDRVVDVLEAVQLLINTPLFVVVLAVDDRYIARALENAYKGVLKRRGTPSGIDYLEKIIQIPYRTRPINRQAIKNYLRNHIEIEEEVLEPEEQSVPNQSTSQQQENNEREEEKSVLSQAQEKTDQQAVDEVSESSSTESISTPETTLEAPPPKVAKFTKAEFEILQGYCEEVDLSPRTAKRLINIYKILKILWFRSNRDQSDESQNIQKAVLAMLVLSGRYPTFMREVFAEIARFYEERPYEKDERTLDRDLLYYFNHSLNPLKNVHNAHLKREQQKFENDVNTLIEPINLRLLDLGVVNFNLAISFCFVGDIGYDPEDYQADGDKSFDNHQPPLNGKAYTADDLPTPSKED
ncbi:MAG: P-loop NTPase fold protein [Cyanobacteria bacterium P01_F01_bin.150]